MGDTINTFKVIVRKLKKGGIFEILGVVASRILKWFFKEYGVRMWARFN
jgi:hypothetical protein